MRRGLFLLWPTLLLAACVAAPAADSEQSQNLGDPCASSSLFAGIATRAQAGRSPLAADKMVTLHNTADSHVLIGGVAIFAATADLIASARNDVAVQTWRWDPGSAPTLYLMDGLRRLEERRRAEGATSPVVVRMLINMVVPQSVNLMTSIGAQLAGLSLDPQLVRVDVVQFSPQLLGASHAKTVVVDGQRALVMGANFATGYAVDNEWLDSGVIVGGDVAQSLFADFASVWSRGRLWLCRDRPDYTANSRGPDGESLADPCFTAPPVPTTLPPVAESSQCLPMLVTSHEANPAPFPFAQNDTAQAQMFLTAVDSAKRQIFLQTPNLNESALKKALVEAARRGVVVQLLLSKGFEETGESLPGRGGPNGMTVDDLYASLTDVPNACRRMQVRWYSADGLAALEGTPPPNSHVKYLSIDGQIAISGSANQDVQSWRNSHEVNVLVDSASVTQSWDGQLFLPAWNRSIVLEACATTQ